MFWNMVHLLLVGRLAMVNFMLTSSLQLFLNIWGGSKKEIKKCKAFIINFIWVGNGHCSKTILNWDDCCFEKGGGRGWEGARFN